MPGRDQCQNIWECWCSLSLLQHPPFSRRFLPAACVSYGAVPFRLAFFRAVALVFVRVLLGLGSFFHGFFALERLSSSSNLRLLSISSWKAQSSISASDVCVSASRSSYMFDFAYVRVKENNPLLISAFGFYTKISYVRVYSVFELCCCCLNRDLNFTVRLIQMSVV